MIRARGWHLPALGGALLVLVVLEALCRELGTLEIGGDRLRYFVWLNVAGACVYFAAVAVLRSRPVPRFALVWVLVIAAGMRILPLAGPPMLSSDVYRYVWDGRVQAAGINPYRYIPADPALAGLRDATVYEMINRAESAPTIYPPFAQLVFAALGATWSSVLSTKLAMVGFECLAVGCVIAILRRAGRAAAQVAIYAWSPLPVWEFAGNGHIDAAAIGCMAAAWLAATAAGPRVRSAVTGGLLALAILCKFLPAAVLPAFWRRWDWRMPLALTAVAAGLYAIYVGAGWRVLGYLPGYTDEEGLRSGSGFFVLRVLAVFGPLPGWARGVYLGLAAMILLGGAAWVAFGPKLPGAAGDRGLVIGQRALMLAAATTVLLSPHYPWYLAWLALFACVTRGWGALYLAATGTLLYLDPYHQVLVYPLIVYGGFLVVAAIDAATAMAARRATTGGR